MKIKPVSKHQSFCTRTRPHYGPCYDHILEDLAAQPSGSKMKLRWLKGLMKRYHLVFASELEMANDALMEARIALGPFDKPFLDDAIRNLRYIADSRSPTTDTPASGPTPDISSRRWVEVSPERTWESIR